MSRKRQTRDDKKSKTATKVGKESREVKEEIADKENDVILQEESYLPEKDFNSTQLYLREIGFSPLLNAKEEIKYGRLVKKGDPKARRVMIVSNLRLVV